MRISAKGRYALAAMIYIAQNAQKERCVTVINIAGSLGLSKIFLEQVFAQLKQGGLVSSLKGAQGGYQLARPAQNITAYDILSKVESSLFEKTEAAAPGKASDVEQAMTAVVFDALELAVTRTLQQVTLADLASAAAKIRGDDNYMFFI